MDDLWDYIVVGAGSAGCVMADRLSRDSTCRVLLLEAGGSDASPLIHMPKGIGKLALNPRHAWHYPVQQSRRPDMPPTETWVRGKGLGGSSSINGMIYVRGQPADYDLWEDQGCSGWNWPVMKAAFQAIEDHELGEGDGRGVGGPVHISSGQWRYPLAEAAIAAGESMGLPRRVDLNGEDQEGVGYFSHNIRAGRRQSAAVAFLRPAMRRRNLKVLTHAQVDGIDFVDKRAVAVRARVKGVPTRFAIGGEVVLCAGTVVSPTILLRSGVGPADMLTRAGVPVIADRGAIGRHLRDHLGFSIAFRLKSDRGNNHEFRRLGLVRNLLRYALARTGPMATGPYEVGAFMRSRPGATRPDLQIYAGAFTFARSADPNFPVQLAKVENEPGFTLYGQMLQMAGEGEIAIASADPDAPVVINPNWLTTDVDQQGAVAMVKAIRRFAAQPALAERIAEELSPGSTVESDEQILDAVRRLGRAGTHAIGSCGMGGADAALDPQLRVRGVSGVRVVDCSAMPGLVSGNTNGPAMAFAWHAAHVMAAPV